MVEIVVVGDTVAYQMLDFLISTVNNVGLAVWLLVLSIACIHCHFLLVVS